MHSVQQNRHRPPRTKRLHGEHSPQRQEKTTSAAVPTTTASAPLNASREESEMPIGHSLVWDLAAPAQEGV